MIRWVNTRLTCLVGSASLSVSLAGSALSAQEPAESGALLGDLSFRTELRERGVTPFAVWTTEGLYNAAGGLKQGGWWYNLLDFGVELDTARLGWWNGGGFMVQAHWLRSLPASGRFSDYTGAFNPPSNIEAGEHIRIYNLHYRHSWRDDAIVLKIGQLAVDDDFMGSDYTGLFLNSAFGPMPSQVGTPLATSAGNLPAFPIYSVAAPGAFLRLALGPGYTQLGLYYGKPGHDREDNYGFDWIDESPPELGLFWEGGIRYRAAGRPATSRLGLSYHTGPVDDYRFAGQEVPPATRQTIANFYAIQDLDLVSDAEGRPKLGLFARAGFSSDPHLSMVDCYADGGLNWFSPFPGRSDDTAGLGVSYTSFGRHFRETVNHVIAPAEATLELTYKAQLTTWLTLQADVQFLFQPRAKEPSGSRETATVLGLRAELTF